MSMTASQQIDKLIAGIPDWRGKMLAKLRSVVHAADPEIVEEWKWMGTQTFYRNGLVLLFNPHKDKVKLTFYEGASLPDPDKLFNAGLEGGKWRAIDFLEGAKVNERALKALVRAAIAHNALKKEKVTSPRRGRRRGALGSHSHTGADRARADAE
jgi:hypothetical protein